METVMPEPEFNRLAALIARGYSDDQQRERYRAETERREKLAEAEREQMRIEREKRREEQNRMQNERNPPQVSPNAEQSTEPWRGFIQDDQFNLLVRNNGGPGPAHFAYMRKSGGPLRVFANPGGPIANLVECLRSMQEDRKR